MPVYSLPSENFIHCLVVSLSLIVVKIPRANCDPILCLLQHLLLSKCTWISKSSISSNTRMKENVGHLYQFQVVMKNCLKHSFLNLWIMLTICVCLDVGKNERTSVTVIKKYIRIGDVAQCEKVQRYRCHINVCACAT